MGLINLQDLRDITTILKDCDKLLNNFEDYYYWDKPNDYIYNAFSNLNLDIGYYSRDIQSRELYLLDDGDLYVLKHLKYISLFTNHIIDSTTYIGSSQLVTLNYKQFKYLLLAYSYNLVIYGSSFHYTHGDIVYTNSIINTLTTVSNFKFDILDILDTDYYCTIENIFKIFLDEYRADHTIQYNSDVQFKFTNYSGILDNLYKDNYEILETIPNAVISYEIENLYDFDYDEIEEMTFLELYNNDSDSANQELIIKFPELTLFNSIGSQHTIKDLFIKIKASSVGIINTLYGTRTTFNLKELSSNYIHSHLHPDAINGFSNFCMGTSELGMYMAEKSNTPDLSEDEFEYLLHIINNYLTWESLEGGPYKKIDDISIGGNSYRYTVGLSNSNINNLVNICTDIPEIKEHKTPSHSVCYIENNIEFWRYVTSKLPYVVNDSLNFCQNINVNTLTVADTNISNINSIYNIQKERIRGKNITFKGKIINYEILPIDDLELNTNIEELLTLSNMNAVINTINKRLNQVLFLSSIIKEGKKVNKLELNEIS